MSNVLQGVYSHLTGDSASKPLRVCVTGAAGQIGYALVFQIASGAMFGSKQPVILHLVEVAAALPVLQGVIMELDDGAYPLLHGVVATADYAEGFSNVDYAILVGAMPRKEGMERSDLLKANVVIFKGQGEAIDKFASRSVKVLVVGNPANTNAAVTSHYAPSIPKENFSALTRLDHNRAVSLAARKLKAPIESLEGVIIWGNHSSTQYADVSHAKAAGRSVLAADEAFFRGEFISTVQKRGAAVIAARKSSSAASAAKAIVDHMHDWHLGTGNRIVSMAIQSTGVYGIPPGVIFSFPVRVDGHGKVHVVEGLEVDDFSRKMLEATHKELLDEWKMSVTFLN